MIAELATMLLAAAGGQWEYQRSGGFPDPGSCDSAARIGDVLVVGCQKGVWRGRPTALELAVACPAQEDRPNRVRAWDAGGFIASTPCGLYRLDLDGGVTRLAHPPDPGALDADGRGRAVVTSEEDLWLLQAGGRRRLEYRLPEAPQELEISGDWLLSEGERSWLLGLGRFQKQELAGWGMHSLPGGDRLLWVQASGRVWIRGAGALVGKALRLPLLPAERVVAARGDQILTSLRWIRLGGKQTVLLPPVPKRPVAVWGGAVPWMVAAGGIYRPVRARRRSGNGCRAPDLADLYAAAVRAQGLGLPAEPSRLSGWLPRLTVSVFGRQTRQVRWHREGAWDFTAGRDLGVFVSLSWPLEATVVNGAEGQREELRRDIERERFRLRERLAVLAAAFEAHCRRGDRRALFEVRAQIEMLTGGAGW
jgi:hypothetical protein